MESSSDVAEREVGQQASVQIASSLLGCRALRPNGADGEPRELVDELAGCGQVLVPGSRDGDKSSLDYGG
jgi:hypothetical protein